MTIPTGRNEQVDPIWPPYFSGVTILDFVLFWAIIKTLHFGFGFTFFKISEDRSKELCSVSMVADCLDLRKVVKS